MKLSWLFVILLLIFVAVFSVQNAGMITVRFLSWEIFISAALVIQLAALLGGLVGLAFGAWSRRPPRPVEKPVEKPLEKSITPPASSTVPSRPALIPPPASIGPSGSGSTGGTTPATAGGSATGSSSSSRADRKPGVP